MRAASAAWFNAKAFAVLKSPDGALLRMS